MPATDKQKPRVLVIYTGGTIGMYPSPEGYVPVAGFEALLHKKLESSARDSLPAFDLIEFDRLIDSANLMPGDWTAIAESLICHYDDYDGFVVLHGTDTMAYTASALSFQLQGLNKPVIVTGSQIPLSQLRNDALDNLITALMIAGFYDVPEVCIYFNGRLLRGNRSRKVKATGLDAFDSPNFPWLGQVGIHFELHRSLIRNAGNPAFRALDYNPDAVVMLPIYPGLSASVADKIINNKQTGGVIIQSYGVGNLPDSNRDLMNVLEEAAGKGKVLVNLSSCFQGSVVQGAYACSSAQAGMGILSGGDMTPEAALCKLHTLLAAGSDHGQVVSLMQQNLCGEMD
ncbi:MAG: asparaginase domain-containing protein [Pontibacterium sp.]